MLLPQDWTLDAPFQPPGGTDAFGCRVSRRGAEPACGGMPRRATCWGRSPEEAREAAVEFSWETVGLETGLQYLAAGIGESNRVMRSIREWKRRRGKNLDEFDRMNPGLSAEGE